MKVNSVLAAVFFAVLLNLGVVVLSAQEPTMLVPNLRAQTITSGLTTPTAMAFIDDDEYFILEKNTGRVKLVTDGVVTSTVLDLAVNNASERGLLGIALHPNFPTDGGVYLFWSCIAPPPPATNPFFPTAQTCSETPQTGADSPDTLAVPLLGNRVDRFIWNGTSLTYDRNIVQLLSFQNDGAPIPPGQGDEMQPARANHDGGPLAFGFDGKLYIMFGDAGRRGQLQNLPSGPTLTGGGPTVPDDQFGGPQPDNPHFTGVILRLNPDGTTPTDNPFYAVGGTIGGEVGNNIRKIFAYGIRNSFGMAVDPYTGSLWQQENGEDAFDELNLVEPGMNSGWIQIIGPSSRVFEYRQIETTSLNNETFPNLQQFRWGPERIAMTQAEALSRLFVLQGSRYSEPEFSWKYVVPPAGIGFVNGKMLGPQYNGDLIVGLSVTNVLNGALFHFNLTGKRNKIGVDSAGLEDRVADNLTFYDLTESEELLFGADFGVVTDIKTGPNGNLFIVSLSRGRVFEIRRVRGLGGFPKFTATLTGAAEVPVPGDPDGTGRAMVWINEDENRVCFTLNVANIALPATLAHIHRGAAGVPGPVVVTLIAPTGGASSGCVDATDAIIDEILANPSGFYVNVHNAPFPGGAVRGQLTGDTAK
jgi:aldose sugar dehydrogenase